MSEINELTSGTLNPSAMVDTLQYKLRFARDNPDYFYPAGIWVFCGPQGSGKTLSAVQTLRKMAEKYPKAMIVSNLEIHGLDREIVPLRTILNCPSCPTELRVSYFCSMKYTSFGTPLKVRKFPSQKWRVSVRCEKTGV